jgi:hypothetical protein
MRLLTPAISVCRWSRRWLSALCAVRRGIDERDYRDLTRIGSLELKSRKRSSLAAMMELRHSYAHDRGTVDME